MAPAVSLEPFCCPMCMKVALQNGILCGECVGNRISDVRKAAAANELENDAMRSQINLILAYCSLRLKPEQPGQPIEALLASIEQQNAQLRLVSPSRNAVEDLALHLKKLELMNKRIVHRAAELRVARARETCQSLEQKFALLTNEIHTRAEHAVKDERVLRQQHKDSLDRANTRTLELQEHTNTRVAHQVMLRQLHNYTVAREIILPGSKLNVFGLPTFFWGKPILTLSMFAKSQIFAVNIMLQDLIRLQRLLTQMFAGPGKDIKLPFLAELEKLLPNQKFYASVQNKLDSITNTGASDLPEDPPESEEQTSVSPEHPLDKITILDNAIKIPISSRTANTQRRSSLKSNEQGQDLAASGNTPDAAPAPAPTNLGHDDEKSPVGMAHGKKLVVVPHKILTKPVSKLSPHDMARFVRIIVMILMNFHSFFDQCPVSDLLTSTPARAQDVLARFCLDFRIILHKVASMDGYFQHPKTGQNNSAISSTLQQSLDSLWASYGPSETGTFGSSWIDPTQGSSFQGNPSSSRAAVQRMTLYKLNISDRQVYGTTSKAHSGKGGQIPELSRENSQVDSIDAKWVARRVYELLMPGHNAKGVLSIMEQSRARLDGWDVVSKMSQPK